MSTRIITSDFIQGQLNSVNVPLFFGTVLDQNYAVPTETWISADYSNALKSNLGALGLLKWASEAWDCDDFSWFAAGMAKICNATTPDRKKAALAFGIFIYLHNPDDPTSTHAICFFFDEKLQLRFYEPQTQRIVTLTTDQVESCGKWLI